MANIVKNEKGFLIIEASSEDMMGRIGHLGKMDYCDSCAKSSESYYYLPLMDKWVCKECYKEWYEGNVRNDEDLYIEIRNFNNMKRNFDL